MDVSEGIDPGFVIEQLIAQNKDLRFTVAYLSAHKRFLDDMNKSRSGMTPELVNQLSPQALKALQTMEFS